MTDASLPTVDLTNCDREPIHIPGSIQPHGVLLVLSEPDLHVVQASANITDLTGRPLGELLGVPLADVLGPEPAAYLREVLESEAVDGNPLYLWTVRLADHAQSFDGLLHRHLGALILELERKPEQVLPPKDFYRSVRAITSRLQSVDGFDQYCQQLAEEVKHLTGFDRVMVYRFGDDGSGTVIGEALEAGMEPFLGLRYPASDIPQQARRLYVLNWLRLIASVHYTPVPVVPTLNPATEQPLDLSYAVLRSVSPIHLEYLGNMGVGASMSVSLVRDGQLWGLIACHHNTAKYIPYEIRTACEFLAQAASLQVISREDHTTLSERLRLSEGAAALIATLAQSTDWGEALRGQGDALARWLRAGGLAVQVNSELMLFGRTPSPLQVQRLLNHLREAAATALITSSLPREWPEWEAERQDASGVLAMPISKDLGDYLIWFRPEVIQEVTWAGQPDKAVTAGPDGPRLSPRRSFEAWKEVVQLTALPWRDYEVAAAEELRTAILGVVIRNAERLEQINRDLEQSNQELDAFAYIASHDLKEPLRGLHNYAHFLLEDYGELLDEAGRDKLDTLVRLTQRMETLIESLLHYSRVGRVEFAFQETNLEQILADTLELLGPRIKQLGATIVRPRPLPALYADRVRIGEVFNNLISNALKYTDNAAPRIEIGWLEPETSGRAGPTFYVRDNGIGIPEKHFDAVFKIFKRLHARNHYGGGTGAGLTIVKKIVERHGGSIWIESAPEAGTTFFFTLQD